ncbi:glycosyltransferase 87 family protein [Actinomadura oligospora]|uniref:glycosyltransferase 87 family protein n=1 Tax=Actinomadura oligospora TaxID=111804 RepID=UPI0006840359|nr:glycosyltransferase 87 family protein [Actinomadura oligospora]
MKMFVRVLLAVEVAALAVWSVVWDSLDFRIYRLGGGVVTEGTRLYTEQLAEHWYTNSPVFALVCSPLADLPLTVARVGWQFASMAALVWACANVLDLAGRPVTRNTVAALVAAAMLLEPMYHSFFQGQVNLILLALVVADVRAVARGRVAGAGIGLAAAMKLTPGIFIVLLLVTGRIRAAAVATGTFAVAVAGTWLIAPDASRAYWTGTFRDTSRVGVTYISNQSPFGMLSRMLGGHPDRVQGWYPVISVVVAVAGLAVAALWARRGDWLGATAVTGVTGLLVSPISWAHHWVWVLPALVLLVRDGRRVAAACAYVLFVLSPLWWTPHDGTDREWGFHWLTTAVANCYLLSGVAFLVYTALELRRPGRAPEPSRLEPVRDEPASRTLAEVS